MTEKLSHESRSFQRQRPKCSAVISTVRLVSAIEIQREQQRHSGRANQDNETAAIAVEEIVQDVSVIDIEQVSRRLPEGIELYHTEHSQTWMLTLTRLDCTR